ncbi:MAG TPA: elongation factor P maturation arginine rhamnosyltransferase EarP [Rubrivivax sp.]|nr:elongation factor P maturation arginine rhamnosyltransferase EarP [Burkholderiales bacterium]HNU10136.1 elongation factor P maturation arginine rhamnosyltransferase EarP [Rubrivivax sp.]
MRWEIFCRVIDNHGDLGFCWRLAAELAARSERIRLWVDDASALAWMAPAGAAGVDVRRWDEALVPPAALGEVVIEAYGCDPPPAFVEAMSCARQPPVWINLEYLSAEDYVERSHRLPSPQASGLVKWFFYPGFTPRTGGLLREQGLFAAMAGFDRRAWLSARGFAPQPHERVFSLFAYAQAPLADWLPLFAQQPTLLLVAPGPLQRQLRGLRLPAGLRVVELPWLTQPDYDRLLWSCDLNAVRGEDSFVRAQWAGQPMLWQIYPQHDHAHAGKLQAWLARLLQDAPEPLAQAIREAHQGWNGLGPVPCKLPDPAAWRGLQQGWRDRLLGQPELTSSLLGFVAAKRAAQPER